MKRRQLYLYFLFFLVANVAVTLTQLYLVPLNEDQSSSPGVVVTQYHVVLNWSAPPYYLVYVEFQVPNVARAAIEFKIDADTVLWIFTVPDKSSTDAHTVARGNFTKGTLYSVQASPNAQTGALIVGFKPAPHFSYLAARVWYSASWVDSLTVGFPLIVFVMMVVALVWLMRRSSR